MFDLNIFICFSSLSVMEPSISDEKFKSKTPSHAAKNHFVALLFYYFCCFVNLISYCCGIASDF